MQQLNENQWMALGKFYGLVKAATYELDESLYTGNLNNSRSAIHALWQAADQLDLPDGLMQSLRMLAVKSLQHTEQGGNALQRANLACCPIDEMGLLLENLFIEHGRMALADA